MEASLSETTDVCHGTTAEGGLGFGTAFVIDTGGTLTVLHEFVGDDGLRPFATLTEGAIPGVFYGVTAEFHSGDGGTVFTIDTPGAFNVLHSFLGGTEAASPWAPLLAVNGAFYGTTLNGGPAGAGTIYRVETSGTLTTLHAFTGTDGARPTTGLTDGQDGYLYGTTEGGGSTSNTGTLYRIDANGVLETLHEFVADAVVGSTPMAGLTRGLDGTLYGTTTTGGPAGAGTIFKYEPDSDTLTTLHSLTYEGGWYPYELTIGADGKLYGTTRGAGDGWGTVFALDLTTTPATFTRLHSFQPDNGEGFFPVGGLVEVGGLFYGTTTYGGTGFGGTIFTIDPNGNYTTLYNLDEITGGTPSSGLLRGSDGLFYGTTLGGTIYSVDTSGNASRLYEFYFPTGPGLRSSLIQTPDGTIYGTAATGGTHDGGFVFRLEPVVITTTLDVTPSPSAIGEPVTLTATVTSNSELIGWVEFFDGDVLLFDPAVENGSASFVTAALEEGDHDLRAVFRSYNGFTSESSTVTHTVAGTLPLPTETTLFTFGNPSPQGEPVLMLVTVTAWPINATGVVEFFDGSTSLGTVTLNDGFAYFESDLAAGAHELTAHYLGDTGFQPSESEVVIHTVTSSNHAPVAHNQAVSEAEEEPITIQVTASDADADDNLEFVLVTPPAHGQFVGGFGESVEYQPNQNFHGTDTFTFKVNDGTVDSNVATVTITITPINDRPVALDGTVTVLEDFVLNGALSATDVDGPALTFAIVSNPTKGDLHINAGTGTFNYSPDHNLNGADSFTFRVTDGDLTSNVATVSITITPRNDRPVAQNGSLTTPQDTAASGMLTATDVDNASLTYAIFGQGSKGVATVTNAATGAYTYVPNPGATGSDAFTFRANDGEHDSDVATISVDITPVLSVAVVAPNGGEKLFANVPVTIRWTSQGAPTSFDVALSRNGGSTYTPIATCAGLPGSAQSCSWTPTGAATSNALIRVTATGGAGTASDVSNAVFQIATGTPSVTVTAPNTAVSWAIGSARAITWNHNLGVNAFVRIELSRDNGASWETVAPSVQNSAASSGAFPWVVTGAATTTALVRVAWVDGPASDVSNADVRDCGPGHHRDVAEWRHELADRHGTQHQLDA